MENGNISYNEVSRGASIVMVISQKADPEVTRGLRVCGWF